jgi:hypothetical protein
MKRWLLKQWHRFTLGRTALHLPGKYRDYAAPGSVGAVAYELRETGRRAVPVGVVVEVHSRTAADVPRGVVRIVLETCE